MQKPISYSSVRDIFVELKNIHIQAAECCDQAAYAIDQRPALLASLFRYQQEVLDNHLSLPSGNVLDEAKSIKVPFVPIRHVNEALDSLKLVFREDSDAVVEHSFKLQLAVINLLRELSCTLYGTPASQILFELIENFEGNQEETLELVAVQVKSGE